MKKIDLPPSQPIHRLVPPFSWVGHIPFAMWLVKELKPNTFVELGVHTGNSFFAICQAVQEAELSTRCIGVDTWEGDFHAGVYDDVIWNDVSTYTNQNYPTIVQLIRKKFDDALVDIPDGSIDLLHIDGFHTYEAVKHDFETWQKKLSDNAFILFHDIAEYRDDFGVHKFWDEVKVLGDYLEFKHHHGLGVLNIKKSTSQNSASPISDILTSYSRQTLQNYFEAAGKLIQIDNAHNIPTHLQKTNITLYWASDNESYKEQNSTKSSFGLKDELQSINLIFNSKNTNRVRIDISDCPSVIDVYQITLLNNLSQIIWTADINCIHSPIGCHVINQRSNNVIARVVSNTNDPNFEISIPTEIFDGIEKSYTLYISLLTKKLITEFLNFKNQPILEDLVNKSLGNLLLENTKQERLNECLLLEKTLLKQDLAQHKKIFFDQCKKFTDQNKTLVDLSQKIESLESIIFALNNHIDEIRQSNSWKVTGPIRFVSLQIQRCRKIFKIAPQIIKNSGGYTKAFYRALRIYRKEGIDGLRRAFSLSQSRQANSEQPNSQNYQEWIRKFDSITPEQRKQMCEATNCLQVKPYISIILPVYNTPVDLLDAAIKSVVRQIYPNWELCIADDASTNKSVHSLLEKYSTSDPRIKVHFRKENGHISAASNTALELATGEYIALLDHDDLLAESALFWVVKELNAYPDARVIYSDEDKIDTSGNRFDPHFKCNWNYDLFLCQNMISHLGVYQTALAKELGGFQIGFEGSQDYDLALRCIDKIDPSQIRHIPRVLYHWRATTGSTALSNDQKPYAFNAAKKSIQAHLNRKQIAAEVIEAPEASGMQRIKYHLPDPLPSILIIIPTRDRVELLKVCIDSILTRSTYYNYEICIVDNGSVEEKTHNYFNNLSADKVHVLRDALEFNFSRLNNSAVANSNHDYICMMNNDIEVLTPNWIEEMLGHAIQPGVGAVGARLWYPDEKLQHGGVILGIGGVAGHAHKYLKKNEVGYFNRAVLQQSLSAVTAACLVIKRDIYNQVGGLDEKLQIAFNDVDFCLRVREAGYRNVWTPYAEFTHYESASRGLETTPEKQVRFNSEIQFMKERWKDILTNDPCYSHNLTLVHEDFSLSWEPKITQL